MKVYVIEKGWYWDKHIVGIVETEDEAQRICDAIKGGSWDSDSVRYEEYDTSRFKNSRMRFTVDYEDNGSWHSEYDEYGWDMCDDNTELYENHYIIYANHPSEAIKIAQDMRSEKLAKENRLI